MRASLSKSDNALSSNTNVVNCRFKRHHSIDDDYSIISSSSSDDQKKIHVHFHPDLISSDHRVPLVNDDNQQQIIFEKSTFSLELMVSKEIYIRSFIIKLLFGFLFNSELSNGLLNLIIDKRKYYSEN